MDRHTEDRLKQQTYDDFRRYAETVMRDEDNPNLSLQAFGDIGPAGQTHMPILLDHVTSGERELYTKTEAFRPGTTLKARSLPQGGFRFIAYVPFVEPKDTSRGRSRSFDDYSGKPSFVIPQVLIVSLLLHVIAYMRIIQH